MVFACTEEPVGKDRQPDEQPTPGTAGKGLVSDSGCAGGARLRGLGSGTRKGSRAQDGSPEACRMAGCVL